MSTTTTASPLAAIVSFDEDTLTGDQRADVLTLAEQILRGADGDVDLFPFDPTGHVSPVHLLRRRLVASKVNIAHDPVDALPGLGEYVLILEAVCYRDPAKHERLEPIAPLARDILRLGETIPASESHYAPEDGTLRFGSVDLSVGDVSITGATLGAGAGFADLPSGLKAEKIRYRLRFDITANGRR
ncbi:hypothetical protein I8D64_01730 [Brachybacterium sp. MASK1Z-5]|uniref:Uncharacterized protein n=1 Tax=Brachybacterium halotolerans TaxID=2795215 RepID=A0ABS1B664_9MICO|nr:hypothetical protein [Brachybacterium halotolerans]MBK0330123.1 hypothetical protein [Brachybacterium halotolerans]